MSIATETQYDQLVRAGREAREQADNVQWIEGELALQIDVLPPTERPRDPETGEFLADPDKALKRYAEDIEINYRTLRTYRQTADAWPSGARAQGVSWRTHYALNTLEDRFDVIHPGMTSREAEKIARDRTPKANYSNEPGWHELLGHVGDSLIAAEKHLTKVESALTREPSKNFRDKAGRYAGWAEALTRRLHDIENNTQESKA